MKKIYRPFFRGDELGGLGEMGKPPVDAGETEGWECKDGGEGGGYTGFMLLEGLYNLNFGES